MSSESEMKETKNSIQKNLDSLKKMMFLMMIICLLIPMLFCMYLMTNMMQMQNKIDELIKLQNERSVTDTQSQLSVNGYDIAIKEVAANKEREDASELLDKEAYSSIEKDTSSVEKLTLSSTSSGKIVSDIDNQYKNTANGRKVYLTFDDGPSDNTARILQILKEENVKATFFVVAQGPAYYDDYKKIVEEGHTIGLHSYTHVYSEIYKDIDAFEKDVTEIHDLIYNVTGVDTKYYRFPGGSSNRVSSVSIYDCIAFLNKEGYTYYDWNSLSYDAENFSLTSDELNANILGYVRSNEGDSIVLMHDLNGQENTVNGLKSLIEELRYEGYEICPITDKTTAVQHVKQN